MRSLTLLATAIALTTLLACDDSAAPPRNPDPTPELPRGDVQLLVESYSRAGERAFYTMELDGSLVAPHTGIPDDATLLAPSPDGRTIAWLRLRETDDVHIWLMDREGGNRRPLLEGTRVVSHVAWSPDGTRLVFQHSDFDDTDDIWVMDADGTDATNLTPDPGNAAIFDRVPAWSPDGARIAFISNRSGVTRLWTMDADGSDPVQLVPSSVEAAENEPAWSPDGAWIAFHSSSAEDGHAIGLVRPDGDDYRTWPVEGAQVGRIAWTPDGRVLYSANVAGDYDIFSLDPATGASFDLTDHPGHDFRAYPIRWVEPSAWLGFGAPVRHETGIGDPAAVAAGDVTADGHPDILLAGPATEQLRLLRNDGDGTFTPVGSLTAPDDQRDMVIADVSRDDAGDIVLLGAGALSLWLGGAAAPGVPTTHPFAGDGRGVVARDFDVDGTADVAAVYEGAGAELRMLVHGWQSDEERLVAILDYSSGFSGGGRACAGDVTGDGADDVLVLTTGASSPVVLIPGHGDISFGDAFAAATGFALDAAAVPLCADFDGDRRTDLAVVQPGRQSGITILRSAGTSLGATGVLAAPVSAAVAADADRDGDIDILAVHSTGGVLHFLRNRGDGRFATPASVAIGGTPFRLAVADFDGDLWPDVAIAATDGSIAALRNRGR